MESIDIFRSDRGPGFNGIVDDASLDKWLRINYGSTWIVGTPYNHNAQHLAERYCRLVKERLAKSHVDGIGHWGQRLDGLEHVLNIERKADSKFSPYEILTGMRPVNTLDMLHAYC